MLSMRWNNAILIVLAITSITSLALASEDKSERDGLEGLKSLISSFDDPGMDAQDLAFFLATHNYDATPCEGCVQVRVEGKTFVLVPNGELPGLCNITL